MVELPVIDNAIYIADNDSLNKLCDSLKGKDFLALDTEFLRTDTFYPIAGLIQLSCGNDNYLIDPLAVDDWEAFKLLLTDTGIVKVLHSCSEDLEVFDRLFNVLPKPLFDTQIAAAMLGYGFSLSYQKLVDELLAIHVEKGETRSNWLQRPLTSSQCHYAALDVEYLSEVYQQLKNQLESKGRLHWLMQDCERLLQAFVSNEPYYKKVKSAWKLSPRQLHALDKLTIWRESQARNRDVPRGRILKDKCCYEIISSNVSQLNALSRIADISPKTVRKEGEVILQLIADAKDAPEQDLPQALPKPLPVQVGTMLKQLKATVRKVAAELDVAPEVLVRKKDYESLLRSGFGGSTHQLPPSLLGWREEVIGELLLKQLAG